MNRMVIDSSSRHPFRGGVPVETPCFGATIVRRKQVAGFDISEYDFRERVSRDWHAFDLFGVSYALSGSACDLLRDGERVATRDQVYFEPPDVPHRSLTGPFRVLGIHWKPGTSELDSRLPRGSENYGPIDGSTIRMLMLRLRRELHRDDAAARVALHGLSLEVVAALQRGSERTDDPHRPTWLARAEEYLRASFRDPISLIDLALELDLSPAHVARSFHSHAGCTVGEFVRQLRIADAAVALRADNRPIAAIALQAGFGDQAAFSRAFKTCTGHTPREFRTDPRRINPRTMRNA